MGFNVVQVQNFTCGYNNRYPKIISLNQQLKIECNETTWTEMYSIPLTGDNNKFLQEITLFIKNKHYFKLEVNGINTGEILIVDEIKLLDRVGVIRVYEDGGLFAITINLNNIKHDGTNLKIYQKRFSGIGNCEMYGYTLGYFEEII